jgi:Asp-tRNA(Asn)/Glu-tRNA(Gln) amidotransferase A subunit family amidase
MSMTSPVQMTAVAVAAAVQSGDLTVAEVAEAVIERYEQRNHDVQAFAYFNPEQVRAAAKELDAAAEGLKMYSATCDTAGFYARSADDLVALADVFEIDQPENRDNLTPSECRAAYRLVDRCRAEFDDIAAAYDVVLAPSATGEAPVGIESTGDASFNGMWTALQVPVVNVPGHTGPAGMPVGLSLVGRRYDDRRAIAAASLAGTLWS